MIKFLAPETLAQSFNKQFLIPGAKPGYATAKNRRENGTTKKTTATSVKEEKSPQKAPGAAKNGKTTTKDNPLKGITLEKFTELAKAGKITHMRFGSKATGKVETKPHPRTLMLVELENGKIGEVLLDVVSRFYSIS